MHSSDDDVLGSSADGADDHLNGEEDGAGGDDHAGAGDSGNLHDVDARPRRSPSAPSTIAMKLGLASTNDMMNHVKHSYQDHREVLPVVAQFRCFSLVFELGVKPGNLLSFIIQGSLMFSRLRCLQILIIFERKKDRFGFQKLHFLRISFLKSYFDDFLSSLRICRF